MGGALSLCGAKGKMALAFRFLGWVMLSAEIVPRAGLYGNRLYHTIPFSTTRVQSLCIEFSG